jgi:hypothetical protein
MDTHQKKELVLYVEEQEEAEVIVINAVVLVGLDSLWVR